VHERGAPATQGYSEVPAGTVTAQLLVSPRREPGRNLTATSLDDLRAQLAEADAQRHQSAPECW
jgi:hypothetical protein